MIQVNYNVVIFPKMTRYLLSSYPQFYINDYRVASNKLMSYLTSVEIDEQSIPDVCVYDVKTKEWREIFVPKGAERRIRMKKEIIYYSPGYMDGKHDNFLISFLLNYSDCRIELIQNKLSMMG